VTLSLRWNDKEFKDFAEQLQPFKSVVSGKNTDVRSNRHPIQALNKGIK